MVQNLGTEQLDASVNVDGNMVDAVTDFPWALSLVKTGVAWILQTRHNASDGPGSNERKQSYMVSDASYLDGKLRVYQCCVSTHGKVNMSA